MMNFSKRKGFTLVELLIVIVVIGVLSAMMMISSTEAVSSAKAATIVSNLRNIKIATLSWYIDNLDKIDNTGKIKIGDETKPIQDYEGSQIGISKYIGNETSLKINTKFGDSQNLPQGTYCVNAAEGSNENSPAWYVGYCFKNGEDSVKKKLMNRASSVGVYFTDNGPEDAEKETGKYVWMKFFSDIK